MAGGQRATSVTLRRDLTELVEEIQFSELNLTAEAIAPSVGVAAEAGRYPVLPREARMKVPDTRRHSDGSYEQGQWEWEDDSYLTYEYGFEEPIDNVDALRDAEFINHEEVAASLAYEGLMLGREARVATALLNTTTFTGTANLTTLSNEWDDSANVTAWADIDGVYQKIRGKCGLAKKQLTLILTDDLVDYFFLTTEVKNVSQYTSYAGLLTAPRAAKLQWMADYLGIGKVIETSAIFDVSKLATATSIGKFWSNEYMFLGKLCPSGTRLTTQGVIKQLVWSKYSSNYVVEDYDVPEKNRRVIRCREYRGIKVNTEYGVLIENAKTTVSSTTNI